MPKVTCTIGTAKYEHSCDIALKGSNYIRLLRKDGTHIIDFENIKDFGCFTIAGGSWTTPTTVDNCKLTIMNDDGSIGTSDKKCCEVAKTITQTITLPGGAAKWTTSGEYSILTKSIPTGYTSATHIITGYTCSDFMFANLEFTVSSSTITIKVPTRTLSNEDSYLYVMYISTTNTTT